MLHVKVDQRDIYEVRAGVCVYYLFMYISIYVCVYMSFTACVNEPVYVYASLGMYVCKYASAFVRFHKCVWII